MRIAYLVNAPREHLTGATVRALTLAASAAPRGDSAVIIAPSGSALEAAAAARGLEFAPSSFSASVRGRQQLRSILTRLQPDILHAMSTVPLVLAEPRLLLGRPADGPKARFVSIVVDPSASSVFADGRARPTATALRNRLLTRISPALDGVFAVSEPVCEGLQRLGVSGVVTIGGAAVNSEDLALRAQAPITLPPGRPRIGSAVGQLEPLKGVDVLIRAFARITATYPDATLVIGGEGSQRDALTALAEQLGVSDRVHLIGYLDEPAPLLAALDLHVLPSLTEGLGSVTAQAMALGVPVIATAVGGSNSLITDGVTGLLVAPADAGAIAEAMLRLLGDPGRARELAEAGRADVAARHSEAAFVDATWARYTRAVHAGPAQSPGEE